MNNVEETKATIDGVEGATTAMEGQVHGGDYDNHGD